MNDPTWKSKVLEPVLYKDRLDKWKRCTYGIPGMNVDLESTSSLSDLLGSSYYKSIFARTNGKKPQATVGGLCIVYSGDLGPIMKGTLPGGAKIGSVNDISRWCANLPRIDQVIDAVGPTTSDSYFCVFEDSLFARMIGSRLGMDQTELTKVFKSVGERSADKIQKWLSIATGKEVKLIQAYTSDFDELIDQYVARLGVEMREPGFAAREKNKVAMMYTYSWPALLKEAGYLDSEDVLCCEPFQHFIEMALPSSQGNYGICGYNELEEFFKQNPWGDGKNNRFQVAGFVPAISLASRDFSRQEPYSSVINQSSPGRAFSNYVRRGVNKPFPLPENPIFRDSVNLLFPFEESRKIAEGAVELEKEFKEKARGRCYENMIGDIARVSRSRFKFSSLATRSLETLAYQLEDVYNRLEFR